MGKLTSKERSRLPETAFGQPKERKYPMPDKSHASNAKARASQAVNAGRMSKSEEQKIDRKADRVLSRGGHSNVVNPRSHAEKLKHC